MQVFQRGKNYSLRKRVPKRFADIEPRADVVVSLHTDSLSAAKMKAEAIWTELVEGWEARLALQKGDAAARFASAREIAQRRGFSYVPSAQLPQIDIEEFQDRVAAISGPELAPDPVEAEALLGAVETPSLTVTSALDAYWPLAADKLIGKSKDQVRRWENPRKKAIRNFVSVVGDLPLDKLGRAEFLAFREWLLGQVQDGKIVAGSANKDLTHLGDVLRTVASPRSARLVCVNSPDSSNSSRRPAPDSRIDVDGLKLGKLRCRASRFKGDSAARNASSATLFMALDTTRGKSLVVCWARVNG